MKRGRGEIQRGKVDPRAGRLAVSGGGAHVTEGLHVTWRRRHQGPAAVNGYTCGRKNGCFGFGLARFGLSEC